MTVAAPPQKAQLKLDSIQCLRAVAALAVVVGHCSGAARNNPTIFGIVERLRFPGGAGVDIFFLLSGFIMVFSSERMFGSLAGSGDFLLRRFVRILPLYWTVTALTLLLTRFGRHKMPDIGAIVTSFAFWPYDTQGRHDGFAFPIVDLGWTLNYEMLFYLVFAAFVPLRRARCVAAVTAAMILLVVIGQAVNPASLSLHFWTRPILLEFVAGMLVALAFRTGRLQLSAAIRIGLVLVAVAILLTDPLNLAAWPTTPNDFRRVGDWGVPATLLLIAAVSGRTPLDSLPARVVVLLGDSSYALYLLHPFVVIVMVRVAAISFFPHRSSAPFVALTAFLACCFAIVAHKVVERPVTVWITRKLQRRGLPPHAVPLRPDAVL